MTMFTPLISKLPECEQRLWPQLAPLTDLGFVLYGASAIALQLGHLDSMDFDFFSSRPFTEEELRAAPPLLEDTVLEHKAKNRLTVRTKDGIRLSFYGALPFGRVGEPLICQDNGIQIASLPDLMATKLHSVMERRSVRDYRDIVAMVRVGLDVRQGLASAVALYGADFQPMEVIDTLSNFEGGDVDELAAADRRTLAHAVQRVGLIPVVSVISKELQA